MGRLYLQYSDDEEFYVCSECKTHLCSVNSLISKDFTAQSGKAYLFDQVLNMSAGAPYQEHLRTGLHIIRKVFCNVCVQVVGWTYVSPFIQLLLFLDFKNGIISFRTMHTMKIKDTKLARLSLRRSTFGRRTTKKRLLSTILYPRSWNLTWRIVSSRQMFQSQFESIGDHSGSLWKSSL
mmetsp:Transcript_15216/g.14796  ORF Transcript_15216/g.14796 Transcript_15216/m.14796 type:complete len:179 (-) Transcript_15216:42-578(-)